MKGNCISIRGLMVFACHGVLKSEKTEKQPFIFDIDMYTDFYGSYKSDDIRGTVNYASACALVSNIAGKNSYNLIEKLGYECAFALAETYLLQGVRVTVHKPEAPVKSTFSDIGVTVELERERAYLSIGSSEGDKKAYLDTAIEKLNKTRGIRVRTVSAYLKTAPYGGVAENDFLNCAAEVETLLPPRALLEEIHRIESECGRVRKERWGDRTLDIDIIFYGRRIICENDLTVPHPDYHNRFFVLTPLREIAPDFICPVRNMRVKDMRIKDTTL